jgi:hypothetical protein
VDAVADLVGVGHGHDLHDLFVDQPFESPAHSRLGHVQAAADLGVGEPSVDLQERDDAAVDQVDFRHVAAFSQAKPPRPLSCRSDSVVNQQSRDGTR